MRSLLLAMLVAAAPARADAPTPLPVPNAHAIAGCWEIGGPFTEGARVSLVRDNGTLLYRAHFPKRPRGGPAVFRGHAVRVDGEFELPCRPMSQHGSFCRVRAADDRKHARTLRVRVFAKGHADQVTGKLVEDFVATRCH